MLECLICLLYILKRLSKNNRIQLDGEWRDFYFFYLSEKLLHLDVAKTNTSRGREENAMTFRRSENEGNSKIITEQIGPCCEPLLATN